MYQNASPPNQQHTTSPPEVQREALNLQRESPSPIPPPQLPMISVKRERDQSDLSDYHVPPAKRGLVRTNSDMSRKSSINNNHHHISNNNSHLTPRKAPSKERSVSPNIENGREHRSPQTSHQKPQNGIDNLGTTMLNGMQFKIISKGKQLNGNSQIKFANFSSGHRKLVNRRTPTGCETRSQRHLFRGCSLPQPELVSISVHHVAFTLERVNRSDGVAE